MITIVKTSFFSGALFLVAEPIISLWAQPSLSTEVNFTLLPADHTGVDFNNFLVCDEQNNQLMYEYITSGTGVAVGDGTFAPVVSRLSGFVVDRDVRDMAALRGASGETLILVANNNDRLQVFGAAH